jgi:adenine specific DNA methylase Mod
VYFRPLIILNSDIKLYIGKIRCINRDAEESLEGVRRDGDMRMGWKKTISFFLYPLQLLYNKYVKIFNIFVSILNTC